VLSFFRWVLFFIALLVTLMGGALFSADDAGGRGAARQDKNVLIPRGAGPPRWPRSCEERA
jgi:UPF0755 protein